MTEYEEKKIRLKDRIQVYAGEGCIVAFSGGVDSSLLLKLVCVAAGKPDKEDILKKIFETSIKQGETAYYGDGHASEKICALLKKLK